jgi:hypothetical protein
VDSGPPLTFALAVINIYAMIPVAALVNNRRVRRCAILFMTSVCTSLRSPYWECYQAEVEGVAFYVPLAF